MTDAQTEARAIVDLLSDIDKAKIGHSIVADIREAIATALAAKDAGLEKVKAECDKWREAFGEMHRQTMRAEAQLAEARKALDQAEQQLDYGQVDAAHQIIIRAARRALTGGSDA